MRWRKSEDQTRKERQLMAAVLSLRAQLRYAESQVELHKSERDQLAAEFHYQVQLLTRQLEEARNG